MREIKNLKTSKTEDQIRDEILALRAKKVSQLAYTDWTQLKDVTLENANDFGAWRSELRRYKIRHNEDSKKLDEIISRKPVAILSNTASTVVGTDTPLPNYVGPPTDLPEPTSHGTPVITRTNEEWRNFPDRAPLTSMKNAMDKLTEILTADKSIELENADVGSYNLFRLIQEELIDYENMASDNPPKFLKRYMDVLGYSHTDPENLIQLDIICKNYFTNINEIFFRFEEKIRRVYNMSNDELTKELGERGYRYRPSD